MTAKDLKNALLQEAVQGKLVPQIASEGNARDLLEQIRKERGECLPLATERKRSSATPSAGTPRNAPLPISEDEIPFDIPESWCWCRLGEVIEIETNLVDSSKYLNFIQIAPDDIGKGTGTLITERKTVKQKEIKSINHLFHKDMLLYSKIRPRLQKVVYVDFEGLCSADMYPLDTKINKHYLKFVLLSDFFDQEIKDFENRVKMPKLNKEQLNSTKFPLPPLAEQKRIVEAIEKFMPLIEEYGKKEAVLKELNANIGTLTKKAILQEAVQGKLVPQIPTEGNAKDLLEQIKAQKAKLIKEGKIKKEKPLPEITEDEIPFDIPENWCWCRLSDFCNLYTGNSINETEKKTKYTNLKEGRYYIGTKDVGFDSTINYDNGVKIPFENDKFRIADKDTILMCIEGGSAGRKIAFTNQPVCFGNKLCCFDAYTKESIFFLYYFMQSTLFTDLFKDNMNGIIGGVSVNTLKTMLLPLPPLDEQKRIVAAIEQLLPLCEKLGK